MLDTFGEHGSARIAPDRELRALFAPDAETRARRSGVRRKERPLRRSWSCAPRCALTGDADG
jgi:hypothetical protein